MVGRKDLNHFIVIEEQNKQIDTTGGYKKQWIEKYHTWAKVESLFNKRQIGHELALAKHIISSNYYEFTIRYKSDLEHKMRIIWNRKIFNIIKIIDISIKKDFQSIVSEEII